jgi:6-pyruvoyltetrahydropterin/6-carboxytetrahydropterin synthase
MTHCILITHRVEMAHRLSSPGAPVKCQSIHGHSWTITAELSAPMLDDNDMVLEFGAFKRAWRHMLDTTLDHCLVVAEGDPVAQAILAVQPDARITFLPCQPSTESLARWCMERTEQVISDLARPDVRVRSIHVQETPVNAATYRR